MICLHSKNYFQSNQNVSKSNNIFNRGKLKSGLNQVFYFKLGCFCYECNCMAYTNTPTFRVENSEQILSWQAFQA